jgi:hypothetical protein
MDPHLCQYAYMNLSPTEQMLTECIKSGEALDLLPPESPSEITLQDMQSWGDQHQVRAQVIRDALRGVFAPTSETDPHGIRLRGVTVVGNLDLDHLATEMALNLVSCYIPDGISASRFATPYLNLSNSFITCTQEVGDFGALDLRGAQIDDRLILSGATVVSLNGPGVVMSEASFGGGVFIDAGFSVHARAASSAIIMKNATVKGSLHLGAAKLTNTIGAAWQASGTHVYGDVLLTSGFVAEGDTQSPLLVLDRVSIDGMLNMRGGKVSNANGPALSMIHSRLNAALFDELIASGGGEGGTVRMLQSRVEGQLSFMRADLCNRSGPAIVADGIICDGGAYFGGGFHASGSSASGTVRLLGAQIKRQLGFSAAKVENDAGPALVLDDAYLDGSVFLDDDLLAHGAGPRGALRLLGTRITGQLAMTSAHLENASGPALQADGLSVDAGAHFGDGFTASGTGEQGAVRLIGARVRGQLSFSEATIRNPSGCALNLDGASVGGDAFFEYAHISTADSLIGAIRAIGVHISGQLGMAGAYFANDNGPAFFASGATVSGGTFLRSGFVAIGHGEHPTLQLAHSQLGEQLDISNAYIGNSKGTAFSFQGASLTGGLFIDGDTIISGPPGAIVVDLENAHVRDRLTVPERSLDIASAGTFWDVNGLTYNAYPSVGLSRWLAFISKNTPYYSPQPYQQLADAARASGHMSDARKVLMRQHDDQSRRGGVGRIGRTWSRFTKITLGYGYQPWRALLGVAVVLLVSISVSFTHRQAYAQVIPGQTVAAPCNDAQILQLAVDTAVPLVRTSSASTCRIASSEAGQTLSRLNIGLSLGGWALTALFAAGFTRAVRQP